MILLGELALWVGLVMAAWGVIVLFAGDRFQRRELVASGERALYATCVCMALSTAGLLSALVTSDFSFTFVAAVTSANMPLTYKVAALWAGTAGIVLVWTLAISMYAVVGLTSSRTWSPARTPYVTGILAVVVLVSIAAMCFAANPYARLAPIPSEGRGMHPLLQNPAIAVHPPSLYLAYAATTIPFAHAVGGLLSRRWNTADLLTMRRWLLVSWALLGIGMLTGMWWAYSEPAWGGTWAMDPVANLSLLPWITTTLFLHLTRPLRGGNDRAWLLALASLCFPFALVALFIGGGGIISMARRLTPSSASGWFTSLSAVVTLVVIALAVTRRRDLATSASREDRGPSPPSAPLDNPLLIAFAFAAMWGTLFPLIGTALRDETVVVGLPLVKGQRLSWWLLITALTATPALIGWRRSSHMLKGRPLIPLAIALIAGGLAFALGVRDPYVIVSLLLASVVLAVAARRTMRDRLTFDTGTRHRLGAYLVRAGVLVVMIAFVSLAFTSEREIPLAPGETATLADPYGRSVAFTSQGVSRFQELNRHVIAVALVATVDRAAASLLTTERRDYTDSRDASTFESSTEAGIRSSLRQDTYVVLTDVAGDRATVRIAFNPGMAWVWIGGALIWLGGILVMWPGGNVGTPAPEPRGSR